MPSRPRWPVVLWDYDGTLADTIPGIVAGHHQATESVLGIRLDESQIRRRIGEPARRRIEALVPDHHAAVFARYSAIIGGMRPESTPLFPDLGALLRDLASQGARQGIVTSRPRAQVVPVLEHNEVLPLFSVVVGLEDSATHKPDPGPLLRAMADLHARPDQCVYVGDAVVDVRAAAAAGIASVAVPWGAGTLDALHASSPTVLAPTSQALRDTLLVG